MRAGRNRACWIGYSVEELDPWLDRIKTIERAAKDTYVVTNNHYLGKGIVNAFEILAILKDQPVTVPESLLERYPELREFAAASDGPAQLSLPTD